MPLFCNIFFGVHGQYFGINYFFIKNLIVQGLQENGLYSSKNKSEKQTERYDCWSHWRYVLDGLMHLPGALEGPGIQSCIHDVLLYGSAEFGTVSIFCYTLIFVLLRL